MAIQRGNLRVVAKPGVKSTPWGVVDLFSGCGGASAGFLEAGGFEHVYAADLDPWANKTYSRNLGFQPKETDLGELARSPRSRGSWASEIRRASDKLLVIGCAPCQGFSSHVKVQGDRHERNPLLVALGQLATAVKPEAMFIENVPDVFADRNWVSFNRLREILVSAGYQVRAAVVNFAELGVPQERFRGVVLARRGDRPTFPAPGFRAGRFSTVRDWIGDLPPVSSGETHPDDPMHQASNHRAATIEIIEQVPLDGGSRPPGVGPACLDRARGSFGGYTDVYGRLAWDLPAPTITARCRTPSCGRFVHPDQNRGLTAREAGLLQSFPKRWYFEGPFDDRFKQIGNAVPPLAARRFAEHIAAGWPAGGEEIGTLEVEDESIGPSFSVLIPGIRRRRVTVAA